MRISLSVEDIGAPFARRAWIAEIIGYDEKFKYARKFLKPNVDYSDANSVGSRGVYKYYWLETGKIYEVSSPQTWRRTDRYFCCVDESGDLMRLDSDEMDGMIRKRERWLGVSQGVLTSVDGPAPTSTVFFIEGYNEKTDRD